MMTKPVAANDPAYRWRGLRGQSLTKDNGWSFYPYFTDSDTKRTRMAIIQNFKNFRSRFCVFPRCLLSQFHIFCDAVVLSPMGLLIRLCHTTSSWKGLSNMTLRIKSHWPLGLLPSSIHNIRTRPSTSSVICRTKCTTILASNVWWSLPCRRRPWDSSCQRLQKGHFAWRCVRSLFCWIV